ncbi:hypothetical protein EMCRGX_G017771 [Ephydatia muelleri]
MSPINREPVAILLQSALFAIILPFSFTSGVCTVTGYESYTDTLYTTASITIYYDEQYTECCGLWCMSHCERTRVAQK